MRRRCVDCVAEGVTTRRPAPYGGPRSARCATHHRAVRARRKNRAHSLRTEATFDITGEQYWELYRQQGGRCFICQISTGASRRLAVDHDHRCDAGHPPNRGCRRCVRGLVCNRCNKLVAFLGPEALHRAIVLLTDPPARRVLADCG